MRDERGGVVWSTFAIIGIVVVLLLLGVCALVNNDDDDDNQNGWAPAVVQVAYHDGYDDGDGGYGDYQGRDDDGGYSYDDRDGRECRGGGCGTHSRRCERSRGDCRSSFSPGPFKDSPVTICAPYSCNSGGKQSGGNRSDQPPPDEQPQSVSCLVPFPYHCDPRTA